MSNTNSMSKKFPIRVNLDKIDEKKFLAVQELFKLKNKADVVRFCVNKVFHNMVLEIDEDIQNEILRIITSRHIKIKYGISSVDDFIKRAISDFLDTLKTEWSLKNWSTRQILTQEESDTAVAILELQMRKIPGVTIEDLEEYLNVDKQTIRKHLEKFIADSLLDFRAFDDIIYYYAR